MMNLSSDDKKGALAIALIFAFLLMTRQPAPQGGVGSPVSRRGARNDQSADE